MGGYWDQFTLECMMCKKPNPPRSHDRVCTDMSAEFRAQRMEVIQKILEHPRADTIHLISHPDKGGRTVAHYAAIREEDGDVLKAALLYARAEALGVLVLESSRDAGAARRSAAALGEAQDAAGSVGRAHLHDLLRAEAARSGELLELLGRAGEGTRGDGRLERRAHVAADVAPTGAQDPRGGGGARAGASPWV